MKIALFGRSFNDDRFFYLQQLVDTMERNEIEIRIYAPFMEFIHPRISFKIEPGIFNHHYELPGNVDFMFSIGGDGTMLEAITLIRDSGIPLMGINLENGVFIKYLKRRN